jgi:hypothetical protein
MKTLRRIRLPLVALVLGACAVQGKESTDTTRAALLAKGVSIESADCNADDGCLTLKLVHVDNPLLTFAAELETVQTNWGGLRPQQHYVIDPLNYINYNGDFLSVAREGDGNAEASGLTTGGSSINDVDFFPH